MFFSDSYFKQNSVQLFEDCLNSITSSSSNKKLPYNILNNTDLSNEQQITISNVMIFTSNILKNNLTEEELTLLLEDLSALDPSSKDQLLGKYKETIDRLRIITNAYEEPDVALNYASFKSFPLKMSLNEEILGSLNGRLMDV